MLVLQFSSTRQFNSFAPEPPITAHADSRPLYQLFGSRNIYSTPRKGFAKIFAHPLEILLTLIEVNK